MKHGKFVSKKDLDEITEELQKFHFEDDDDDFAGGSTSQTTSFRSVLPSLASK